MGLAPATDDGFADKDGGEVVRTGNGVASGLGGATAEACGAGLGEIGGAAGAAGAAAQPPSIIRVSTAAAISRKLAMRAG